MNNYELTERGKIVIAVVLVIILLVIPASVILAMGSCSGSSPPESGGHPPETGKSNQDETSDISITPSPSGDGFNPAPDPDSDNQQDQQDSTTQPSDDSQADALSTPEPTSIGGDDIGNTIAQHGPVELDLAMGTMAFDYSLDAQNALSDEIFETLGNFLTSSKNTSSSLIKIEIPHLDTADEKTLVSAMTDALSAYNITGDNVLYVRNDTRVTERHFNVLLSYTVISSGGK